MCSDSHGVRRKVQVEVAGLSRRLVRGRLWSPGRSSSPSGRKPLSFETAHRESVGFYRSSTVALGDGSVELAACGSIPITTL